MKVINYKRKGLMTAEELKERYKASKALALSVEKWVRAGYFENWMEIEVKSIRDITCGLCVKHRSSVSLLERCGKCPLFKDGIRCGDGLHPWQNAARAILNLDRPAFMKARKNLLARMKRAYDRGER